MRDNTDTAAVQEYTAPFIHSVQITKTDLSLAAPLILLHSDDVLRLGFDDLRAGVVNYYYTCIHCDQRWVPSDLDPSDYLNGFGDNPVSDYAFSSGTRQRYTHYTVDFPDENISFRLSGNYAIKVWASDDPDHPVLIRRFFIWENMASVDAGVLQPAQAQYRKEYQQVRFSLNLRGADIGRDYGAVRVTLIQNRDFRTAMYDLKPRLINNDMLTYDDPQILFPAGKEFRHFDTRNLSGQTDRIARITRGDTIQVWLSPEESRTYSPYFFEKDIDGNFVIGVNGTGNPAVESDYALVHFTLKFPYFNTNGLFYVYGALSEYGMLPGSKMQYDFDKQEYDASLYLKQGYYNYLYVCENPDTGEPNLTYGEGNAYETGNSYMILVYVKDQVLDYDRLIGSLVFSSGTK